MTNNNFERKIQVQTTQYNNNNKTLFIPIINTDGIRRWCYFIIIRKKTKIETRLTTIIHLETGCSIVGQDLYDVMLHHYIHNSLLYQRLLCTYLRAWQSYKYIYLYIYVWPVEIENRSTAGLTAMVIVPRSRILLLLLYTAVTDCSQYYYIYAPTT